MRTEHAELVSTEHLRTCDRGCPAAALVVVARDITIENVQIQGQLAFCGHHYYAYLSNLKGWIVVEDHRPDGGKHEAPHSVRYGVRPSDETSSDPRSDGEGPEVQASAETND